MKLDWSLADEAITVDCDEEEKDLAYRKSVRCKVFLGFTSNLISSGIRDTVRYLVQHHMVSFFVCVHVGENLVPQVWILYYKRLMSSKISFKSGVLSCVTFHIL